MFEEDALFLARQKGSFSPPCLLSSNMAKTQGPQGANHLHKGENGDAISFAQLTSTEGGKIFTQLLLFVASPMWLKHSCLISIAPEFGPTSSPEAKIWII